MKTRLTVLTALMAVVLPALQPGVPRVTYLTGVIKDAAGKPQTGMLGITFSLYQEQEGGTPLWTETQSVALDEHGGYAVLLGTTQPDGLPVSVFSAGKARWLGVAPQLPGAVEQPRVALAGVPYAMKAVDADTLGGLPASAFPARRHGGAAGRHRACWAVATASDGRRQRRPAWTLPQHLSYRRRDGEA